MSKEIKAIRGQLRQLVKEILPELLAVAQYEELRKEIHSKMERIETNVKDTMREINERSKDTQSYLVRAVSKPAAPKQEG